MDPPPTNTMLAALENLYALSAIDDEALLTKQGREMANLPMDPSLAKVLIVAAEIGCSHEMLIIVSMLSVQNIWYRPREKQEQADQKKAKFHDHSSDHITLLNVYTSWERSGCSKAWCFENFVQARSMSRAKDIRLQLEQIFRSYRIPIISCGRDLDLIKKALCAGFFRNSARKQDGCYKTLVEEVEVFLHPSSALFQKQAEWIIYNTLILTTREYCHISTAIHPQWLVDAAPTFFKAGEPTNKRKIAEKIKPLHNKYASGEDDWRLSAQRKKGRSGGAGTWG